MMKEFRWICTPRGAAVALVGAVAFIGILSEPASENNWFEVLLVSKLIGFFALFVDVALIKRWYFQK